MTTFLLAMLLFTGPGRCMVVGPVSGQCICTHFVHYAPDPQNCGYCYHAKSMHAPD